ncbi:hypothetical protein GOODEAATRI_015423 [Goodea atripinnis]|uniref:Uncharacterized protein n=1 Tax=Goodea atripinnis TaxID=208336 RepID=A0ABV0NAV9_9TELE
MCALARIARPDKSQPKMRVSASLPHCKCNYGNARSKPTHLNMRKDKHDSSSAGRDGWQQSFGFKAECSSLNLLSNLHIQREHTHLLLRRRAPRALVLLTT